MHNLLISHTVAQLYTPSLVAFTYLATWSLTKLRLALGAKYVGDQSLLLFGNNYNIIPEFHSLSSTLSPTVVYIFILLMFSILPLKCLRGVWNQAFNVMGITAVVAVLWPTGLHYCLTGRSWVQTVFFLRSPRVHLGSLQVLQFPPTPKHKPVS